MLVNEDGFKKESTENHITISDLEPSTDYNIRVRVVSVTFKASEYSDNYKFSTADLSDSDLSAVDQLKILVVWYKSNLFYFINIYKLTALFI